jgi:hypothetical protein
MTKFATVDGKILRTRRRCADPWLIRGPARVELCVFLGPVLSFSEIGRLVHVTPDYSNFRVARDTDGAGF